MDQFVLSGDESQFGATGGSRHFEKPINHRSGVRECSRHIPRTQ